MTLAILMAIGCTASKKARYTDAEINDFKSKIAEKQFEFTANVANPLGTQALNSVLNSGILPPQSNVNRIDLTGISNFLKIKGDSVSAALPYYGERQFGSAYNSNDIGINFDQANTPVVLVYDEKKKAFKFRFEATKGTENLIVNGWLFPNGKATIFINSSERNTIGYLGNYSFL